MRFSHSRLVSVLFFSSIPTRNEVVFRKHIPLVTLLWGMIGIVSLGRSTKTTSLNLCFFFGSKIDNCRGYFFKGFIPSVDCSSDSAFFLPIAWIQLQVDSSKIDTCSYRHALLTRNVLVEGHTHAQYSDTPKHCSTNQTNYTFCGLLDINLAVD